MKGAALLLTLCLAGAVTAACSSPAPEPSAPSAPAESPSAAVAPSQEPPSSRPRPEPSSPPASSQVASSLPQPSSPEPEAVSQPQPAVEAAPVEDVLALQQYLFDTLPQESYAYLSAGAQEGALTIGCLDEAAIQAGIDKYSGNPCPVVLVPAQCSVAQTLAFLELVDQQAAFPEGAYVETASDIPGAFEGARLALHAASEEEGAAMEEEILALAEENGFPTQYLRFFLMGPASNPDT